MSPTEALMWTVEKDPSLRSDFVNVTILDRPPDPARLAARVRGALDALPRLRQRVLTPPLRLAPPEWAEDTAFDLDHHLRRVAAPAPGGMRQLLDLAAVIAASPFDRTRPLWELTVVEALEGGRAALVQKVHHTITDGVGGMRFSLALLDLERDPAPGVQAPTAPSPRPGDGRGPTRWGVLAGAAGAASAAARWPRELAGRAAGPTLALARHPTRLPQAASNAIGALGSLRRQLVVTGRARSPLMTGRSAARRFEAFSVPLEPVRSVAHRAGASVNDVFVAGVAGGLGLYHERMGRPVDALRMAMAVNLRRRGDTGAGNRFAPVRAVVPVGPEDPRRRLDAVREALRGLRSEPALGLADVLARAAGGLPTALLVAMARNQTRTVDFATSNLRGAPVSLYLAGARVEANHPMGPTLGSALNVTLLSYDGTLDMGINLDRAAVTDPDALVESLAESFAGLVSLA